MLARDQSVLPYEYEYKGRRVEVGSVREGA